jgi:hypothetical protein
MDFFKKRTVTKTTTTTETFIESHTPQQTRSKKMVMQRSMENREYPTPRSFNLLMEELESHCDEKGCGGLNDEVATQVIRNFFDFEIKDRLEDTLVSNFGNVFRFQIGIRKTEETKGWDFKYLLWHLMQAYKLSHDLGYMITNVKFTDTHPIVTVYVDECEFNAMFSIYHPEEKYFELSQEY